MAFNFTVIQPPTNLEVRRHWHDALSPDAEPTNAHLGAGVLQLVLQGPTPDLPRNAQPEILPVSLIIAHTFTELTDQGREITVSGPATNDATNEQIPSVVVKISPVDDGQSIAAVAR